MGRSKIWRDTPNLEAALVTLWTAGMPALEIAKRLNAAFGVPMTKNAILGRAYRMKLSLRAPVRHGAPSGRRGPYSVRTMEAA